jgi:hypothetical protein
VRRVYPLLVIALLALAGCGSKEPSAAPPPQATTGAGSTPPSASATPTPSGTRTAVVEFSVDGAGPYQLGAKLNDLKTNPGLDEVVTGGATCPQNTTARGTGTWADVRLSFRPDGTLYLAVNRSTTIPTPSGAWLGTSLTDLKKIYVGIPGQQLTRGAGTAYLVTTLSGRGILFDLDPAKKVMSMAASEAVYLKSSYLGGTDFC